ncbi:MAG: glycosyltransferase family 2 protein [Cellvibrionaceae bacterium]|nr:glycosyltransferase family 2 protein [Cellvibrionaceae bacterium]
MSKAVNQLVSVVIPLYNAEKYIAAALDSVFTQSYTPLEVVVVDDGSKDKSVEIVNSLQSDTIKLVQQENLGPAAARNRGVQEARGRWIAFLDADDIWQANKIETQLAVMGPNKWAYCDSEFMGGPNDGRCDSELNQKYQGMVLEQLTCSNFIGTSGVIVERSVFLEIGGFDGGLRSIQDWDLWLRIASEYPVSYADAALVRYRVHSESTSRSARKTLPNHKRVIEKTFAAGGAAARYPHLRVQTLANSYSICSHIAEEEGDLNFSLKCALHSSLCLKSSLSAWLRFTKLAVKWCLNITGMRKAQSPS